MSERNRGTRSGQRGGGRGAQPYQRRGRHDDHAGTQQQPKELAIELEQYRDKRVQVKLSGGRQVAGILKGFDPLLNLVLDHSIELIRRFDEPETTRPLGLLVCRGPSVLVVSPAEGASEIDNPFQEE